MSDERYHVSMTQKNPMKLILKKVKGKNQKKKISAFNNLITHRTFFIRGKQKDPIKVLQKYKERIFLLLRQKLKDSPTKFYITVKVKFYKYIEGEKTLYTHYFHGCTQSLLHETNLNNTYDHSTRKIYENFDAHIKEGSGFMVDSVEKLDVCTYRYSPIQASNFISTPKWIADKKAVINIKNDDGRCFEYSVLAALRLEKENIIHHLERVHAYAPYLGKLKSVTPNMRIQDIPKFERENNIPIAVYIVKHGEKTIYPLYIKNEK